MRKVPTIFVRDWEGDKSLVTDKINPECQWVFDGEGVATRKLDGSCCRIKDGVFWVRYDAKQGKTPPTGFEPAQPEADPETGHWPGWVKPEFGNSQYRWHLRAYENSLNHNGGKIDDGTYEICGPHFQRNPESYVSDCLHRHGEDKYLNVPTTRAGLAEYLADFDIEGIVWHHPDGRMAKIKKRDLGLRRKP